MIPVDRFVAGRDQRFGQEGRAQEIPQLGRAVLDDPDGQGGHLPERMAKIGHHRSHETVRRGLVRCSGVAARGQRRSVALVR